MKTAALGKAYKIGNMRINHEFKTKKEGAHRRD